MGSPHIFLNGLATFNDVEPKKKNDVEKLGSQQETTEHTKLLSP